MTFAISSLRLAILSLRGKVWSLRDAFISLGGVVTSLRSVDLSWGVEVPSLCLTFLSLCRVVNLLCDSVPSLCGLFLRDVRVSPLCFLDFTSGAQALLVTKTGLNSFETDASAYRAGNDSLLKFHQ